jgi:hypothetical protein
MSSSLYYSSSTLPDEVKVVNLAIGVSDTTNDTLNFSTGQYLVVGEKTYDDAGVNSNIYSLLVNKDGVGINTSFNALSNQIQPQALYVDGDIYFTGNLLGPGASFLGSNYITSNNQWFGVNNDYVNGLKNIYYDGFVTIGNLAVATGNSNAFNIVKRADHDAGKSQFNIQNLYSPIPAQFSIGILGNSNLSPVVMNTPPNTGTLEIHMGRNQSNYFKNYYGPNTDVPVYDGTVSNAPHVLIDAVGRVGINTSANRPLSYNIGKIGQFRSNVIAVNAPATLHVEGPFYASNIISVDYFDGKVKHLDDIYLRQLGLQIPASAIFGGVAANGYASNFSYGDFAFSSNVYISGSETVGKNLTVGGSASIGSTTHIFSDLTVDGNVYMSNAYYRFYSNLSPTNCNVLCNLAIQFSLSGINYSNLNQYGLGVATPGSLGAGISPQSLTDLPLINQLVSIKRNPSNWELELDSKSDIGYTKQAVIGHPSQDLVANMPGGVRDGSLVIATPATAYAGPPSSTNGNYGNIAQNIYFFPGREPTTVPFLTAAAPPSLAVLSTNQVAVNSYAPISTGAGGGGSGSGPALSVTGDLALTGKMYLNNSVIATFLQSNYVAGTNTYTGVQYSNVAAPYIGINRPASYGYSLSVAGKIQSADGYFTGDGHRYVSFYDSTYLLASGEIAPTSNVSASNIFAWGNVGVGVPNPQVALSIKDNNLSTPTPTAVQLVKSDVRDYSRIEFLGSTSNYWHCAVNHSVNRFEIGNNSSPLSGVSNVRPFMIKQNPGGAQVYVNTDANGNYSNYGKLIGTPDSGASLTVGGNIAVMGDVNITGAFRINSTTLINSNIYSGLPGSNLTKSTDIYIGGRFIQLDYNIDRSATSGRGVVIGKPFPLNGSNQLISTFDQNIALRVYSGYMATPGVNQYTPVATFQSGGANSIIEFAAASNTSLTVPGIDPRNTKVSMGLYSQASNINTGVNNPYNFAILDGSYKPYISFYNVPGAPTTRYIGINNPNIAVGALMHIYAGDAEVGSNMLRLTKAIAGGNDTTTVCPSVDLQKTYSDGRVPTMWSVSGPNAAWYQKMAFIYSGSDNVSGSGSNERFTFTNSGCIGIGATQPTYALDAYAGPSGGLRLWDTSNMARPLIVFGAGTGMGTAADYRMVTSNNRFYFNTYTPSTLTTLPIFNADNTGAVTFSSTANTTINGSLNIGGSLLLNGVPFVSSSTSGSVTFMAFSNISVNPFDSNTNPYGGFAINTAVQTSNLFYIHSGKNQNMLVLDSAFDQAQIHFRTTSSTTNKYNVYRMDANNSNFEWKFYPNYQAAVGGGALYFSDCNLGGYSNAFSFGASGRAAGAAAGEFDTNVFGSVILNAAGGSPNVFFGSNTSTAPYIKSSNNALVFYAASNIGIGTTAPGGAFSIYGGAGTSSKSNTLLRIDQNGVGNFLDFYSNSVNVATMTSNGFVGIGTTAPVARLSVVSSNTAVLPLGVNTPSSNVPVVFSVQQQGMYGNIAHLYNYSNEGVMVNNVGYVGINTLFPQSNLHVVGGMILEGPGNFIQGVTFNSKIEIFGDSITHGGNITDSDASVKTDLIRIESALDKVKTLTGYTFTNIQSGKRNTGLIAQDVQAVLPEAVYTEGPVLGLAYGNLMGLIVEAIKDLGAEIDAIKTRLGPSGSSSGQ